MQEYVYEEQAMRFLEVAAKHYEDNKKKWMKYFNDSDFDFDEDVFSDSIIIPPNLSSLAFLNSSQTYLSRSVIAERVLDL